MLNVLTNDANSKSVVHSFIKEVAVELNNIWVVLGLEQLDCLFLRHKLFN